MNLISSEIINKISKIQLKEIIFASNLSIKAFSCFYNILWEQRLNNNYFIFNKTEKLKS